MDAYSRNPQDTGLSLFDMGAAYRTNGKTRRCSRGDNFACVMDGVVVSRHHTFQSALAERERQQRLFSRTVFVVGLVQ